MVISALARIGFYRSLQKAVCDVVAAKAGVNGGQVEVGGARRRFGAHDLFQLPDAFEYVAFVEFRDGGGNGSSLPGRRVVGNTETQSHRGD